MYLSVTIASEVALLVPWSIIQQDDEELSFQSLFAKIQSGLVSTISSEDLENSVLQRVYVGTSKESFSVVDASHNVNSVCGIFGSFVKFIVAVSHQSVDLEVLSKRPRLDISLPNSLPSLLRETSMFTLKPVKELLNSTLRRLELKGKAFQIFDSASKTELEDFWSILLVIEPLLTEDSPSKEALKSYPSLVKFIQHCCSFKKYAITIKKCGQEECPICKTVRMPMERFSNLYTLPNPSIGEDGHYKDFQSVIKTDTSKSYAPSELTKNSKANLGFNVTQQHAKNTGTVIQCEECSMWRLIFSKKKLSPQGKADLARLLDDISYTCGATFDEINLPESLNTICIKTHNCHDKIENLYYSSGFEPICIHCGTICTATDPLYYPQCSNCRQSKIKKQSRGRK